MSNANETAKALELLQQARGPMLAINLARNLGMGGSLEARRQRVRAVVKRLRGQGYQIIATTTGGYWLTADAALWADYTSGALIHGKRVLAEIFLHNRPVVTGQRMLFAM